MAEIDKKVHLWILTTAAAFKITIEDKLLSLNVFNHKNSLNTDEMQSATRIEAPPLPQKDIIISKYSKTS